MLIPAWLASGWADTTAPFFASIDLLMVYLKAFGQGPISFWARRVTHCKKILRERRNFFIAAVYQFSNVARFAKVY
jgi:hypothetical protein